MDEHPTQDDADAALREAAFFDLDKTIIAKSRPPPSRARSGRGPDQARSVVRSAYAQLVYLLGGADEDQMERLRAHCRGSSPGGSAQVRDDRGGDPARVDRADRLRRGGGADRGPPRRRPRRRHRLGVGAEMVEPIGEILGVDQ